MSERVTDWVLRAHLAHLLLSCAAGVDVGWLLCLVVLFVGLASCLSVGGLKLKAATSGKGKAAAAKPAAKARPKKKKHAAYDDDAFDPDADD